MIVKSGCLEWKEEGPIGIITITGKPKNNLPSPDFADPQIVKEWIYKERIKGIIVTGEGNHFSSGASIEQFERIDFYDQKFVQAFTKGREILSALENLEKPVIAAINGACLGGGMEIALACHIRYCSNRSIFGFTELNHGIIPALEGIDRMAALVGKSKTMELLLTSDTFGPDYALEIGLVNRVVNEKTSLNYSIDVLRGIISKGEKPVRYAIRAVNNSCKMSVETAMEEESLMFKELVFNHFSNGG